MVLALVSSRVRFLSTPRLETATPHQAADPHGPRNAIALICAAPPPHGAPQCGVAKRCAKRNWARRREGCQATRLRNTHPPLSNNAHT